MMIYNLGILLSNGCPREENDKDVLLPTEEDALSMLKSKTSNDQVNTQESQNLEIKMSNEQFLANNNLSWRYANYADIQKIEDEQILSIKVISEWDSGNAENLVLVIKNAVEIDSCFSKSTLEEG